MWRPDKWKNFDRMMLKVKIGDVICNPVASMRKKQTATMEEINAAYELADKVDAALRVRGMKLDHTATAIGFVEPLPGVKRSHRNV